MTIPRRTVLFCAASAGFIAATALTNRDEVAVVDDVPYGASHLSDTDKVRFENSIASQLKQAGLRVPKLELFEETSWGRQLLARLGRSSGNANKAMGLTTLRLEGKMISPESGINQIWPWLGRIIGADVAQVINIPPVGEDDFTNQATRDPSPNKTLDQICACGKQPSQLDARYAAFRVFVALHETSHYVDYAKNLKGPIIKKLGQNFDKEELSLLSSNIGERIADAGAAIYILSNYRDGRELLSTVIDWRDSSSEPEHYTSSTVSAVIQVFEKDPRRGLSIVQASEMAADVVDKQGIMVVGELNQAIETYSQLKSGKADPDAPAIRRSAMARRRLFAFDLSKQ